MPGLTDIKRDSVIEQGGKPYQVLEAQHTKIGRGGAMVRTKLKNLTTGALISKTFKGSDKVNLVTTSRKDMQYLYADKDSIYLMDSATFAQVSIPKAQASAQIELVPEGATVVALIYEGKIVGIELPKKVTLQVTETEPGQKGDTAGTALKPATVETGVVVKVPLFIKPKERIVIDTRSGNYLERAK